MKINNRAIIKAAFDWCFALVALVLALIVATPAFAVEPIKISNEDTALDLSRAVEIYNNKGNKFTVSTAPDLNGIVRRIEVEGKGERTSGDWAVFALANATDRQIDRLVVAPKFRLVNSGFFWPDLGSDRIASITPSEGFALDRQESRDSDVFRVTLNPGTIVTFVVELSAPKLPQIYLWEPDAYKDTVNAYTLYRGIVLGIAGLLALFLTILFVVKGTALFPATAALAWSVLAYICVDFGFLSKLIELAAGTEQTWRAATEVSMAATLVVFLYTYLNLNRWHGNFSYGTLLWLLGLGAMLGVAVFDPPIASGISRISFALTAVCGLLIIVFLTVREYDRAIMIIPTWSLILLWLFGAYMTVSGKLDNDIIQPALGGGLVLIVLLIGFTVMQHAFAGGALSQGLFSDMERQAMAITGSGDLVWDWDVARDKILTRPDVTGLIGLEANALHGAARTWLPHLHPDDRDRFRTTLDMVVEHRRGKIMQDFRFRARDGHYHWFTLKARPVLGSDGEVIRCIGTLMDVTEQKKSEERLQHDAINDNLTGLPNRKLFLDRLENSIAVGRIEEKVRPTVFIIDIDRFKQVNDALGLSAGDTILLTIARRVVRLIKPQDTLARMGGDQFGLILLSETEPARIAAFAEAVKSAIKAPITFAKREIILTASLGLMSWTSTQASAEDIIKDAELAVYQAKRFGGDRIEPFRPAFRAVGSDRLQMESDLRRAAERKELTLVYQPIIQLDDMSIAGFEALMRWDHPRRGAISPAEFIPMAENCNIIGQIGHFALEQASAQLSAWQLASGNKQVFMSVNLSSKQIIRRDLIADLHTTLSKSSVAPGTLKLELTESAVMDNPEQAVFILEKIKALGVGLSLDDFGTGHSSLAYLSRFPFDLIKIDKSFLRDENPKKFVLLRSIINMAHDLGLKVVSEGIESEQDALQLRQMGCEYAQSFLFGEPMTPDTALRLLTEQNSAAVRA
jgi:diguanylate cyclase (GGDEF)-like protein/PAS domain S-box-containing protein